MPPIWWYFCSMNKSWYNFQNKSNSEVATIDIYDEIGYFGITAKDFLEDVKSIGNKDLHIRMNCVGGSVIDGLAIYNILKSHQGYVTVSIEGIAASMGSVIALAGDDIKMAENAYFMIHNPWGGAMGEAEEMRKTADLLDKMKSNLLSIYHHKTQLSEETLTEMMDAETWMDGQEALDKGFVDGLTAPVKVAAKANLDKFANVDVEKIKNSLELFNNKKSAKMTEDLKNWFNGVKEEIIEAVKGGEVAATETEVSVILSDNEAISAKLTELEEGVASANAEREELAGTLGEKESEIADLNAKIADLEAKLAKNEATETEVTTDEEPAINPEDEVVNEWDEFAKVIVK